MASIRCRGGVYQARVVRKGHAPQVKSFTTQPEAEAWASGVEALLASGVALGAPQSAPSGLPTGLRPALSFAQALARYEREVSAGKRGAVQERYRIRHLSTSTLGPRQLATLRSLDFAQFRDTRLKSVAANTVRLELALISHLYETARREWGFEGLQNPVKDIRKPKLPGGRTQGLSASDLERLRPHCSRKLWAIAQFAIETAMRRGEIVGLVWEDVQVSRRCALLRETKNGEMRTVPLSSRALACLATMRELEGHSRGRVFNLETADSVTRAFATACHAAGIRNVRFHDLRHEAVSRLFERGLTLPEVATISGHKTWAMLRRYTHLSAETLASKLG
jgi:integrase